MWRSQISHTPLMRTQKSIRTLIKWNRYPCILFPFIYSRVFKAHVHTETWVQIFTAFYTIAQNCKQLQCLSVGEWRKQEWCTYAMKRHLATRGRYHWERVCVNLRTSMLSEEVQDKKKKRWYMLSCIWNSKKWGPLCSAPSSLSLLLSGPQQALPEWLRSRTLTTTSAGEEVKQQGLSFSWWQCKTVQPLVTKVIALASGHAPWYSSKWVENLKTFKYI